MGTLSRAQARRVALAAQGFLDPRHAVPTMRTFQRTLERTGVLQVDSVNVLQRAHFMPLYSRMGPYDVDLLRRRVRVEDDRVLLDDEARADLPEPPPATLHTRREEGGGGLHL